MDMFQISPSRSYLLRAFYKWLIDNRLTPYLKIDVTCPGVMVPMEFAHDGKIVLNVAPHAVSDLELGNNDVCFYASFGGVPRKITVPIAAVLAIYARENSAEIVFEPKAACSSASKDITTKTAAPSENLVMVTNEARPTQGDENDPNDKPPQGGRPVLRIVK